MADFDVFVDAKLIQGSPSGDCYGLQFRESAIRQVSNSYFYVVCDNGYFRVEYHEEPNTWDVLNGWTKTDAIHPGEWNTIGVSACGSYFVFFINDWTVAELDDNRSNSGKIDLLIDIQQSDPGII